LIRLVAVSDLHGSNTCFRKCLRLVDETRADLLVIAGDFLGKGVVLYHRTSKGVSYSFGDDHIKRTSEPQFQELKREWADVGFYPMEVSEDSMHEDHLDAHISSGARRLSQWFDYGMKTRPKLPVIVIPGNDDFEPIVDVLNEHPWSVNVDGRTIEMLGYEFFGLGYSTMTPWSTPRELTELQIFERLSSLTENLSKTDRGIGVVHTPPFDCGLDSVPELERLHDGTLQVTGSGEVPCGSRALRTFIERVSPMLIICGHCHSSSGVSKIGSTICVNPGSGSQYGALFAQLVVLEGERIVGDQRFAR
jgi:Icc-related predicted phosphoesterase